MQGFAEGERVEKAQDSVTTDTWTFQGAWPDVWVQFDPLELKEGSV